MKKLLTFIYALFIILILFIDSPLLNNVFNHILLNFVLSIIILKKYKFNSDKKQNIISFILSVILFLMLSYRGVLASGLYITSADKYLFFTVLPLAIISSLFVNVSYLMNNKEKLLIENTKGDPKLVKKIFNIIVIFALLSCFSNLRYNNYYDYQRIVTWYKSHEWHTGHTILWQIIFNIIYKICPMSIGVQGFNTILYLFTIKYVLDTVNKYYGKKALIIFTIISAIFMQPILYLGLPYKDVAFSISFLAIETAFLNIVKTKKIEKKDLAFLLVFGILFSNIRHMMWPGFLLQSLLTFIYVKKDSLKKKALGIITLIVFIFTVFVTYITPAYIIENKDRKTYFSSAVPVYMVISFYMEGYDFTEEEMDMLKTYAPLEMIEDKYEMYNMDSVCSGWRMKPYHENIEKYNLGPRFVKANIRLFKKYPIKYIKFLFRFNSVVYEIAEPQNGQLSTHIADDGKWDDVHVEDYTYLSKLHELSFNFICVLKETPVVGDILFRGGFYTFAFIIYCLIDILNKKKEKLIMYMPIFIIYGVFLLALPSQETRYILPCIIVFPLYTIITFEKTKKTNRN